MDVWWRLRNLPGLIPRGLGAIINVPIDIVLFASGAVHYFSRQLIQLQFKLHLTSYIEIGTCVVPAVKARN
jgi:hypothetical protein